jgi:hypothetical protein
LEPIVVDGALLAVGADEKRYGTPLKGLQTKGFKRQYLCEGADLVRVGAQL